ncbi:MAG: undecaprenyl diphosphate synthase family protein, partial [Clostridia bacterium]|nr:undecaprenyl diphosphate synthase family protein [Clostridia bacterium]
YFTNDLFPDFTADKLEEALKNYAARKRRFGKL